MLAVEREAINGQPSREELHGLCRRLVDELGADGCAVSRVVGEMLVLVAEHSGTGRTLQTGHGYLIPDFPDTGAVLATGAPLTVSAAGRDAHDAEVRILGELGMTAVLMLALRIEDEPWGLVEAYRAAGTFSADDERRAAAIIDAFARGR